MKGTELFGYTCVDVITGFKGVVVGYVEYSTGCNQYLLCPRCTSDNERPESHWFDEVRIKLDPAVEKVELVESDSTTGPGPDKPAPRV